jgi:aminomethyltransferase
MWSVYSGSEDAEELPQVSAGDQALREQAAWLDLSSRGKIRATGEDRARLLHAMTTNQVQNLEPGQGCYTFFLNAQGRILADANVLCFEDHFLLDTEPETRDKLYAHLDHYIIADDVTLADETDHLATIAIEGPQAASVLALMDLPEPGAPYTTIRQGGWIVARLSVTGATPGSGGFFVILDATERDAFVAQLDAAGVLPATEEEARIVRIEHGRPRYGEEITERYLLQETAQMHAVSFDKGCYLGQEIVERVRSRAQIHRVLRRLEIETATPPEAGAKLHIAGAGSQAGAEIASAVYSEALGKTVALAYVRLPAAEPGTELMLGETRATVTGN